MKRILSFTLALSFLSVAFAACTMDFGQFNANGSGGSGTGGSGPGGSECNGGCCTALDCPAPSDACMRATCLSNTCGEEPRPDGTAVDAQTEGDCKKAVCSGGAVSSENDDSDVFDDGNDCTTDTCNGGEPGSTPTLIGTGCATSGGAVCDGQGACVECNTDQDCGADTCDEGAHQCIPADCMDGQQNGGESDTDCGGPDCSPCAPGDDCNDDTDCDSGVCGGNGKCAPPACDDGVKNGDETDQDCGGSCQQECGPGQGCNDDGDCVGNDCSGQGGTCVPNCNDEVTNNNESDVDCGGPCDGCAIGDDCGGMDANCQSNNCGANDKCEGGVLGAACGDGGDCASGFCADSVCCATFCGGTCRACDLAGSVGTCSNIASGMDPDNECAGSQVCDGNAACKKPQGAACAATGECLAGATCVDGVCCNAACDGTCEACDIAGSVGTCTNIAANIDPDDECVGVCDGAGACKKGDNGAPCATGPECTSTFCADGLCCNAACGGLCQACDLGGAMNGTCTNVPNNQDPDNECPGANSCNGAGACN